MRDRAVTSHEVLGAVRVGWAPGAPEQVAQNHVETSTLWLPRRVGHIRFILTTRAACMTMLRTGS
jgi:hypothetical protein